MVQSQAKIQELAEHVPKGHIPRTMTVHCRGELTRKVGDLYIYIFFIVFNRYIMLNFK